MHKILWDLGKWILREKMYRLNFYIRSYLILQVNGIEHKSKIGFAETDKIFKTLSRMVKRNEEDRNIKLT